MPRNFVIPPGCFRTVINTGLDQTTDLNDAFALGPGTLCLESNSVYRISNEVIMPSGVALMGNSSVIEHTTGGSPILRLADGAQNNDIQHVQLFYESSLPANPANECLVLSRQSYLNPTEHISVRDVVTQWGNVGIYAGNTNHAEFVNVQMDNHNDISFEWDCIDNVSLTTSSTWSSTTPRGYYIANTQGVSLGATYYGSSAPTNNGGHGYHIDNCSGRLCSMILENVASFTGGLNPTAVLFIENGSSIEIGNERVIAGAVGATTLDSTPGSVALMAVIDSCVMIHELNTDAQVSYVGANPHYSFYAAGTGRIYNRCAQFATPNPLVEFDNNPNVGIKQVNGQWQLDPQLPS